MAPQTRGMLKRAAELGLPADTIPTPPQKKKKLTAKPRSRQTKSAPFHLLDLLQEIVDMIYIDMLQAGDVGILRTSHQVHGQAAKFVDPHAVYRIALENGQVE